MAEEQGGLKLGTLSEKKVLLLGNGRYETKEEVEHRIADLTKRIERLSTRKTELEEFLAQM